MQEEAEVKKTNDAVQRLLAMQNKKVLGAKQFAVPTLKNLPTKKESSAF